MYKHLIPTGASELADKAVERGITLAKEIGAKITIPTISVPFHILTTNAQMIENTAPQYKRRMAEQAAKISQSRCRCSECREEEGSPGWLAVVH